ncbi:hypothetical protein BN1723_008845 [Verticillium longisporum]|uniref:Uncharacterized protein n=1 Tax=Verticillium longisporum TaxID=100787 RepID=A0A0G4KQE5_VERLO|nr:putative oxidoreductase YkvO like protein [Verticillium longisporum]CRK04192.1 hypothetical protein BN1723_008845 [Verticillium longisporum]CRK12008.1 hypothetical protein BN1708_002404 [Verticillium longisporum]
MAPFTFEASKTAVITGGASGIGLAVAQKCLDHGMKVVIADQDSSKLMETKQNLGSALATLEMDVGRAEDWIRLQKLVDGDFQGRLDFLFLNAGIQPSSGWKDTSSFQAIFNVNLFGVVHGISTFLPTIKVAPAIVITGSKQGITNPPSNPAYNASKSAVKSIAEHLSYDLKDATTNVHLLVPGWTFTGLGRSNAQSSGEKPAGAWTSEQVANYLVEKMTQNEFYIICPDSEVTEEMDAKRIAWAAQDLVRRRPPLSRWREEFKEEFSNWNAT